MPVNGTLAQRNGQETRCPTVAILIKALDTSSAQLRLFVVQRLGRLGAQALPAVPRLQRLLHDPDTHVRDAASQALREIAEDLARKQPSGASPASA